MIYYLSCSDGRGNCDDVLQWFTQEQCNILVSFAYKKNLKNRDVNKFKNFMADSGAFTAMNAGKKIDEQYINDYIDWIKTNKIKNYIEMDLDQIVGYDQTVKIRNKIEKEVGYQSIPVWHKERGADGWKRMCDEYDYVAISLSRMTDSSRWLMANNFEPLKWFMSEANKRNCKVHALGCNSIDLLSRFHFYSCDSSTHTLGARFGTVLQFENGKIKAYTNKSKFMLDYDKLNEHNVKQMMRMVKYAEQNL